MKILFLSILINEPINILSQEDIGEIYITVFALSLSIQILSESI